MVRGVLSLIGMIYCAALLISRGLAESFEGIDYPDRAMRVAIDKNKLLQTSNRCPFEMARLLQDTRNGRIVQSRQDLLDLENRNFRSG